MTSRAGMLAFVATAAIGAGVVVPATMAASAPPWKVLGTGLDNPRGLTIGAGGAVYVAESGRGGNSSHCIEDPEGGTGCLGQTGAVSRVAGGKVTRLAWFPSVASPVGGPDGPAGTGASGPSAVVADGTTLYVAIGMGGDTATRASLGSGAYRMGRVVKVVGTAVSNFADIAAFEQVADPDHQGADSNPNGIARVGGRLFVADAGGNSLLAVGPRGGVGTVTTFPNLATTPPRQAVPTSVTAGPDGSAFVGQLTGGPFAPGLASVFKVDRSGRRSVYASGFGPIMGVSYDASRSALYVLESGFLVDQPGKVTRIDTKTGARRVVATDLPLPGGIDAKNGRVVVTLNSVLAGAGMVVELTPR